ncbi:MarR family winged helix-turn-helix transcriptional regulator [Nocardioides sp. MAHUQ-72]|uniref:MarR family winged helix-turn-helix transcriptional regulator n=1 Tax=unclassified Nocardioides TaxID=2615069 RepID=UPI003614DB1C
MDEPQDWTDHHVARWRDHWVDITFDDDTEAIVTRIARLTRHLKQVRRETAARTGLQDFEYDTLHRLMISETPGTANPSALAEALGLSGAGMTGRLDGLEQAGWVKRTPSPVDRRRVEIEVTRAGAEIWRRAMAELGAEETALVGVLAPEERATLNGLLKKMTLAAEASSKTPSDVSGPSQAGATSSGT